VDPAAQLDDSAFIDPGARDQVTVEGADAQTYLQSQIAQDITDQQVGDTRWTLVLDPSGKIDVLARIARTGDEVFVLDTDAGFGEQLAARLNRFKIRVKAEVTVNAAESAEPSARHETARVNAGWPRMGFEIMPGKTIPAETGLVGVAVSLTKGCYPGQELVERMDSRGADAPRSLRIVDAPEGAAIGDPVFDSEGTEAGRLTSEAPPIALAYINRAAQVGTLPPDT